MAYITNQHKKLNYAGFDMGQFVLRGLDGQAGEDGIQQQAGAALYVQGSSRDAALPKVCQIDQAH